MGRARREAPPTTGASASEVVSGALPKNLWRLGCAERVLRTRASQSVSHTCCGAQHDGLASHDHGKALEWEDGGALTGITAADRNHELNDLKRCSTLQADAYGGSISQGS